MVRKATHSSDWGLRHRPRLPERPDRPHFTNQDIREEAHEEHVEEENFGDVQVRVRADGVVQDFRMPRRAASKVHVRGRMAANQLMKSIMSFH